MADEPAAPERFFGGLQDQGFDVRFSYHADAIIGLHFPDVIDELTQILGDIDVPMHEIMGSGGGEAKVTQRLRKRLSASGWKKTNFDVHKSINEAMTYATSHEVDHVKKFDHGTIALEIEWNNKDPFYDRDLENFQRLHADGAISLGILVTRGKSLQDGLTDRMRQFLVANGIHDFASLEAFGIKRTDRQKADIENRLLRDPDFPSAVAHHYKSDKFGTSTTHWEQLNNRFARGVGSPCPLVGIGIPYAKISG